ncbi:MAG: dodecin family protein [Actinomycetota bacterium]
MQPADGHVDKVIRIVATSSISWEDAARNAVGEASKSIHDLRYARVSERDVAMRDGTPQYRIKVELAFQLDRNRVDARGIGIRVRRALIVANRTLAGERLQALVRERLDAMPTEFHVLVPQPSPTAVYVDPATGLSDPATQRAHVESRAIATADAEARLASFQELFEDLETVLTGEVVLGDPVLAAQRVMQRATFDEIIVSTLPPGASRWLKLDLPTRLERTFDVPVTTIVQPRS